MSQPIKVKLKPIEFNLSLGGEPTREEVKQAYLELLINDKFDYELSWIAQVDRGNDFDGSAIEDVNTINLDLGWKLGPNYRISLAINDILDREFEVLPGYGAGGRTVYLGLDLTY